MFHNWRSFTPAPSKPVGPVKRVVTIGELNRLVETGEVIQKSFDADPVLRELYQEQYDMLLAAIEKAKS